MSVEAKTDASLDDWTFFVARLINDEVVYFLMNKEEMGWEGCDEREIDGRV